VSQAFGRQANPLAREREEEAAEDESVFRLEV
jgi:hypothetical protein